MSSFFGFIFIAYQVSKNASELLWTKRTHYNRIFEKRYRTTTLMLNSNSRVRRGLDRGDQFLSVCQNRTSLQKRQLPLLTIDVQDYCCRTVTSSGRRTAVSPSRSRLGRLIGSSRLLEPHKWNLNATVLVAGEKFKPCPILRYQTVVSGERHQHSAEGNPSRRRTLSTNRNSYTFIITKKHLDFSRCFIKYFYFYCQITE